jgi:hypothetical protein
MASAAAETLRSRYVEQAAADLTDNRRRQEELTEQLVRLRQEEALLTEILSVTERFEAPPLAGRAVRRPEGGAAAEPAVPQQRRPLLGELLAELLARHDEPRLAKELRAQLMEEHPDRAPTPQVVRNTLESLVAKGRIERRKQQRSVMYTLVGQD